MMPRPLALLPLPLVSASLGLEAGLGKARCRVWLGVAPRFAPPSVFRGWRAALTRGVVMLGRTVAAPQCLFPGVQGSGTGAVSALVLAIGMESCSLERESMVTATHFLVVIFMVRCASSFEVCGQMLLVL